MRTLRDAVGVPLIVVSQLDENIAAINSVLREAGHAVHCTRVAEPAALEEAIADLAPELVMIFADEPDLDLTGLSGTIFRRNPPIPVLIVRQQVTERMIADAIAAGARDVVSLTHRGRLQAVVERELRARRLQSALDGVLSSASQYQQELRSLMKGATEAITDVQEGIVITANPAWLGMFGLEQEQELAGQPFMDLFSDKDQPSLKGAMQACLKGKWTNSALQVTGQRRDGSTVGIELKLERVTVDGEPAVRIIVPGDRPADAPTEELVEQALCKDPSTSFLLTASLPGAGGSAAGKAACRRSARRRVCPSGSLLPCPRRRGPARHRSAHHAFCRNPAGASATQRHLRSFRRNDIHRAARARHHDRRRGLG